MSRLGGRLGLGAAAVLVVALLVTQVRARPTFHVVAYLAHWDERGNASFQANMDFFTEVSPSWYAPASDGSVTLQGPSVRIDERLIAEARRRGAKVVPVVANYVDGRWDQDIVEKLLADPDLTRAHVRKIAQFVMDHGYDGINIDYEKISGAHRHRFTRFISDLSSALHSQEKLLAVAVHPKTREPGDDDKQRAHDYRGLGEVVDQLRVMAYDYAWETSPPGPAAPISLVNEVLGFAVEQVPPRKIVLGIPLYGYDWVRGGSGESFMWEELDERRAVHGVTPRWHAESQTSWYEYPGHEVWYESARSTRAKVAAAREFGIGGVHFWRLGGEDPETWDTLDRLIR